MFKAELALIVFHLDFFLVFFFSTWKNEIKMIRGGALVNVFQDHYRAYPEGMLGKSEFSFMGGLKGHRSSWSCVTREVDPIGIVELFSPAATRQEGVSCERKLRNHTVARRKVENCQEYSIFCRFDLSLLGTQSLVDPSTKPPWADSLKNWIPVKIRFESEVKSKLNRH